ncbi:MAG: hypothetical protein COT74_13455 [Bdellovibrionales bacterium CG10_big_fil_rev_8_21_14_0_10_45_34]|nr:MAG: hypothetical protein COT74_13455 [Bdellovibrionales bacterium CG10_big_fil_rev_8_21_14_0_10_45_34]
MRWLRSLVSENLSYKFIALLVTLILWITVLGRRDSSHTAAVSMVYSLKPDQMIVNDVPQVLEVKLTGSRVALRKIVERGLEPVQIDLQNQGFGQKVVTISDKDLALPLGARVTAIGPSRIFLDLDHIIEKRLPAEVGFENGQANQHPKLKILSVQPSELVVMGAESILRQMTRLPELKITKEHLEPFAGQDEFTIVINYSDLKMIGILPLQRSQLEVRVERLKKSAKSAIKSEQRPNEKSKDNTGNDLTTRAERE